MNKQIIYLDHAATTPVEPEVADAMQPYLSTEYGNPSATYTLGYNARIAIDEARDTFGYYLNCSPQEIIFTSGGTESDNLAIFGTVYQKQKELGKKGHIVTSNIEHPAVLEPCRFLEGQGHKISEVKTSKNGIVDVDEVMKQINEQTILVSIMMANNEIGTIQPIKKIVAAVKEKNPEIYCSHRRLPGSV